MEFPISVDKDTLPHTHSYPAKSGWLLKALSQVGFPLDQVHFTYWHQQMKGFLFSASFSIAQYDSPQNFGHLSLNVYAVLREERREVATLLEETLERDFVSWLRQKLVVERDGINDRFGFFVWLREGRISIDKS